MIKFKKLPLKFFFIAHKYKRIWPLKAVAEALWARACGNTLFGSLRIFWFHIKPRWTFKEAQKPLYLFSDYKGFRHLIKAWSYTEALEKAKMRRWYKKCSKIEYLGWPIE